MLFYMVIMHLTLCFAKRDIHAMLCLNDKRENGKITPHMKY